MSIEVALLFSDVVDSTLLNARWGDEVMARLWIAHDRIARKLLRDCEGREVGRSDGFLAIFPDVGKAVEFATMYHRGLAAMQPSLEARVGVHIGPITLRENSAADTEQGATRFDIDGVALPLVARVMSVAMSRQTLLSDSAQRALGPTQLRTQSHGYWRLKGLPEPIELTEIGEATAPFVPPADSAKAYRVAQIDAMWIPVSESPNTLPAERDAFFGRVAEMNRLSELLNENARLVTVVGIGGIGKTRLAVRYARSWLGDYPGGAWFCDLSAARTLDGILHAVAQGLDVPLGQADPVQQLGAAIAGRARCLVILDNFEQVARHAEATVGRWLERAGQAQFLVTSREVLGVAGEFLFPVDPLAIDEAVKLFESRAVAGAFDATAGRELSMLPDLVEMLDRLPLAIELAAARSRVMAPAVMLGRMKERFKLLVSTGGRHDRQATLRAALDWSWELLASSEQSALAQLSVFDGGFTLKAAEAVVDLSDFADVPWMADVVQILIEKSFVRQRSGARFDLLRTVQDYAADRLAEIKRSSTGRLAALGASARHARYFSVAPSDDRPRLADLDNIILACRNASGQGDYESASGSLVAAWMCLKMCGPFRVIFELARLAAPHAPTSVIVAIRRHWVLSCASVLVGDHDAARRHLDDGLLCTQQMNSQEWASRMLCASGEQYANVDALVSAQEQLDAALLAARSLGHIQLTVEALNALGVLALRRGDYGASAGDYTEALELTDSPHSRGGLLGNLGEVAQACGRLTDARSHYEEALALVGRSGHRRWEGNTRCNLGLVYLELGMVDSAKPEFTQALAIARFLGYPRLEATVLCNLGILHLGQGALAEARQLLKESVALARSLGEPRMEGQFLVYLGRALCASECPQDGVEILNRAEQLLQQSGDHVSLGLTYCERGLASMALADTAHAAEDLARAEAAATATGAAASSELGTALVRLSGLLKRDTHAPA